MLLQALIDDKKSSYDHFKLCCVELKPRLSFSISVILINNLKRDEKAWAEFGFLTLGLNPIAYEGWTLASMWNAIHQGAWDSVEKLLIAAWQNRLYRSSPTYVRNFNYFLGGSEARAAPRF